MRYLILGVVFLALLVAGATAGLVLAPISLQDLRDLVVVVYGVLGILLFAILIVVSLGIWFAVQGLSSKVGELLDDPIRPMLDEARATARNARGSSEFLTDAAVHPVIRVVAMARGVRRGIGLVSRFWRPRR